MSADPDLGIVAMSEVASRANVGMTPAQHVDDLHGLVNEALTALALPEEPRELYEPIRYVLDGGGKRLRPILLLLATQAAGGNAEKALPAALAVEVFHNFTLVHDDIMDHAAERRGRPTVHVLYDESTAILAGDLMMGLSYQLLAGTKSEDVVGLIEVFHRMVAAVCEGQALDKAFEARSRVTVDDYLDMISRKTGALVECVMALGGQIAGADDRVRTALTAAGRDLGRAFQIQDDLLDLTANHAKWGKTIGGDLIEGKRTYLLLRALEVASGEERAWFERIVNDSGLPVKSVDEARKRMDRLGVLADASQQVERHSAAAVSALEALPATQSRDTLAWLARSLASRAT